MKQRVFTFLFFFAVSFPLACQNLVKNGSFEEFYRCPDNFIVDYTRRFLPGWFMPTKGTPDYFNKCSKDMVGVPQNFMGSIFPADGDGFVGLVILDSPNLNETINFKDYIKRNTNTPITITNKINKKGKEKKVKPVNYREYIQNQLLIPLQRDQLYSISFKYAVANYSTFVTNRLGVVFSVDALKQKNGVMDYKPQLSIDSVIVNFEPGIWNVFADTFRAYGGESYLTIGNFYEDTYTSTILNDISDANLVLQQTILKNQIAYVYIDDVKVEPINRSQQVLKYIPYSEMTKDKNSMLINNSSVYAVLDEVYFNVGNPDTPPLSLCQLNQLDGFLANNQHLGINIYGVMQEYELDTLGAHARLNSFKQWLVSNGVAPARIYGKVVDLKSMPITTSVKKYSMEFTVYSNLIMFNLFTQ